MKPPAEVVVDDEREDTVFIVLGYTEVVKGIVTNGAAILADKVGIRAPTERRTAESILTK